MPNENQRLSAVRHRNTLKTCFNSMYNMAQPIFSRRSSWTTPCRPYPFSHLTDVFRTGNVWSFATFYSIRFEIYMYCNSTWVPGQFGHSGNELTRFTYQNQSSYSPFICYVLAGVHWLQPYQSWCTHYTIWKQNLSHNSLHFPLSFFQSLQRNWLIGLFQRQSLKLASPSIAIPHLFMAPNFSILKACLEKQLDKNAKPDSLCLPNP